MNAASTVIRRKYFGLSKTRRRHLIRLYVNQFCFFDALIVAKCYKNVLHNKTMS